MEYAPVMITTLSRAKYLEKTLNSLLLCHDIEKTELYISVDFPPKDKYVNGYNEVLKLLENYDFSSVKEVYIYRQKSNLGPYDNYMFLEEQVKRKHNVAILSEEDNEFSRNFLEYMNAGLDRFKNNKNIIAVCGANSLDYHAKDYQITLSKSFAPYGVGIWFDKMIAFREVGKNILLDSIKIQKLYDLYKKNKVYFHLYVSGVLCRNKGLYWGESEDLHWVDSLISIGLHLSDYYCVIPRVSKSRTFGNDGSGESAMIRVGVNPQLDINENFSSAFMENLVFEKSNYKAVEKYLVKSGLRAKSCSSWMLVILLYVFKKDRNRVIKFLNKIKRN